LRLIWLLLIFINTLVCSEELTIALPYGGNPPYSFGEDNSKPGIYEEIFTLIFSDTPIKINYVYLSNARIRTSFRDGTIDIECCPIASWREKEAAISTYSDVIFHTNDRYVFALNSNQATAKDEETKHQKELVATVRGYGYKNENLFTRFDVDSEIDILHLVGNNRIKVGIVDEAIARHLIDKYQIDATIGGIHEQIARPLRIHLSKAHILPVVNKSIAQAEKKKQLIRIFNKYQVNQYYSQY